MKIRKGDNIVVISWKYKWKKWKVTKVIKKDSKIVVEGINLVKRHIPKQNGTPWQQIEFEKPINVSNVLLVCPHTDKPTRIGYKTEKWKKVRFSKKSGKVI